MSDAGRLEEFLAGDCVDAAAFALRPDYRVLLPAADGLVPGPGDQASDDLVRRRRGDLPALELAPGAPLAGPSPRTGRPAGR
jgi:hypothetical protein